MGTKRTNCQQMIQVKRRTKPALEFIVNGHVVHGNHLSVSRSVYTAKMPMPKAHRCLRTGSEPRVDVCIKCDKDSKREYQMIRMLEHPNVVKCLAIGYERTSRVACMVQIQHRKDMVEAHQEWINNGLRCIDAVRIATGCARAVEHLHAHRVFHNDIKPDNFLMYDTLNYEHAPVLTDFGMTLEPGAPRAVGGRHCLSFLSPFWINPGQLYSVRLTWVGGGPGRPPDPSPRACPPATWSGKPPRWT